MLPTFWAGAAAGRAAPLPLPLPFPLLLAPGALPLLLELPAWLPAGPMLKPSAAARSDTRLPTSGSTCSAGGASGDGLQASGWCKAVRAQVMAQMHGHRWQAPAVTGARLAPGALACRRRSSPTAPECPCAPATPRPRAPRTSQTPRPPAARARLQGGMGGGCALSGGRGGRQGARSLVEGGQARWSNAGRAERGGGAREQLPPAALAQGAAAGPQPRGCAPCRSPWFYQLAPTQVAQVGQVLLQDDGPQVGAQR